MLSETFGANVAFCEIRSGHDREGLGWADRAAAAEGAYPLYRVGVLLGLRAAAYVRTGDLDTAKRLARELNDHFPFDTWRKHNPEDPDSGKNVAEVRSLQDALKAAGNRDHADPEIALRLPHMVSWGGSVVRLADGAGRDHRRVAC